MSFTAALDADTDHDVNFSGSWKAYDQSCDIVVSDLTKQIDAVWAAGDDAGGRAAGVALANATWYHAVAVAEADGSNPDIVFDTSITAANHTAAHAEYTAYRYTGLSVLTDGSANIVAFVQQQGDILWSAPVKDVNVSDLGAAAVSYTLSTPPDVKTQSITDSTVYKNAASILGNLSDLATADTAPADGGPITHRSVATSYAYAPAVRLRTWTNTSKQVRMRSSAAATDFDLTTIGWFLPQGCRVGI